MNQSIKHFVPSKFVLMISSFSLFLIFLLVTSCSKDSSSTVTPTTTVAFTNASAKAIFDKYCTSCHASGKSNAKDWLYNASDYNTSIKGYISTLYKEVYTSKSMPEGTTMSSTDLAAFKSWYDSGYPAN